jgi:hypothetical protein
MWITDDSELLLEVLEIHDDHLVVMGEGEPFSLQPIPNPGEVTLSFDKGDPLNMVLAAQSLGYDPLYIGEAG